MFCFQAYTFPSHSLIRQRAKKIKLIPKYKHFDQGNINCKRWNPLHTFQKIKLVPPHLATNDLHVLVYNSKQLKQK